MKIRELALFAGGGGGLQGTRILGWHPVCAVEINAYRRRVLLARQRDQILPRFPIWDDVRTFDGTQWRGCVDVVTGGFPCQKFSTASRGRTTAKDLWPEMRRVIAEVEPRGVLAENVQQKPIQEAAEDLQAQGYVVRCCRASASSLGAPHRRSRYWLLAHIDDAQQSDEQIDAEVASLSAPAHITWQEAPTDRILGVDDGMVRWVDQFTALGDGQIPGVVAFLGRLLERYLGTVASETRKGE